MSRPECVEIGTGKNGKPGLAGVLPPLQFNLCHSYGLATLAITQRAPLGIDIEMIRPLAEPIETLVLTPVEIAKFVRLARGSAADCMVDRGRARKPSSKPWAKASTIRFRKTKCRSPPGNWLATLRGNAVAAAERSLRSPCSRTGAPW